MIYIIKTFKLTKTMNKTKIVMTIDFNHLLNMTDDILEINNIEYALFSINNAYNSKTENILKVTNNWFKGRGIPSSRKDLEKLLERLNVSSSE